MQIYSSIQCTIFLNIVLITFSVQNHQSISVDIKDTWSPSWKLSVNSLEVENWNLNSSYPSPPG